jgi:hypothetical protein
MYSQQEPRGWRLMLMTHPRGRTRQKKKPRRPIKPSGRQSVSPQDAAPVISSHPDSHRRLRSGWLRSNKKTKRRHRHRIDRLRGSRAQRAIGSPYRRSGITPCPEDGCSIVCNRLYWPSSTCQARGRVAAVAPPTLPCPDCTEETVPHSPPTDLPASIDAQDERRRPRSSPASYPLS